jgi:hypothetical protein
MSHSKHSSLQYVIINWMYKSITYAYRQTHKSVQLSVYVTFDQTCCNSLLSNTEQISEFYIHASYINKIFRNNVHTYVLTNYIKLNKNSNNDNDN